MDSRINARPVAGSVPGAVSGAVADPVSPASSDAQQRSSNRRRPSGDLLELGRRASRLAAIYQNRSPDASTVSVPLPEPADSADWLTDLQARAQALNIHLQANDRRAPARNAVGASPVRGLSTRSLSSPAPLALVSPAEHGQRMYRAYSAEDAFALGNAAMRRWKARAGHAPSQNRPAAKHSETDWLPVDGAVERWARIEPGTATHFRSVVHAQEYLDNVIPGPTQEHIQALAGGERLLMLLAGLPFTQRGQTPQSCGLLFAQAWSAMFAMHSEERPPIELLQAYLKASEGIDQLSSAGVAKRFDELQLLLHSHRAATVEGHATVSRDMQTARSMLTTVLPGALQKTLLNMPAGEHLLLLCARLPFTAEGQANTRIQGVQVDQAQQALEALARYDHAPLLRKSIELAENRQCGDDVAMAFMRIRNNLRKHEMIVGQHSLAQVFEALVRDRNQQMLEGVTAEYAWHVGAADPLTIYGEVLTRLPDYLPLADTPRPLLYRPAEPLEEADLKSILALTQAGSAVDNPEFSAWLAHHPALRHALQTTFAEEYAELQTQRADDLRAAAGHATDQAVNTASVAAAELRDVWFATLVEAILPLLAEGRDGPWIVRMYRAEQEIEQVKRQLSTAYVAFLDSHGGAQPSADYRRYLDLEQRQSAVREQRMAVERQYHSGSRGFADMVLSVQHLVRQTDLLADVINTMSHTSGLLAQLREAQHQREVLENPELDIDKREQPGEPGPGPLDATQHQVRHVRKNIAWYWQLRDQHDSPNSRLRHAKVLASDIQATVDILNRYRPLGVPGFDARQQAQGLQRDARHILADSQPAALAAGLRPLAR